MDLKKAYNSVPREALWLALKKLGIPTLLIELIRSFHEGMKVLVLVNGEIPDEQIAVVNGLRQGCTMAPHCSICMVVLLLSNGRMDKRLWVSAFATRLMGNYSGGT